MFILEKPFRSESFIEKLVELQSMKALILGSGNIGSVAAEDLAKTMTSVDVAIADNDEKRAKTVAEKISRNNVSWIKLNAADQTELANTLKNHDVTLGFLPARLGYGLAKACIKAKKDLVDVAFMGENPLTLNEEAAKAGVTIVPDCGLAPGISNVLVGHATAMLDKTRTVHIFVGGLPEKPEPPLDYVITWSPESLIDEYTRKVKIIKNGKRTETEVLTGTQEINFPKIGKLEAFFTDGLRTLPDMIHGTEEMWEKTLRYPGHAEKIRMLKDLGFFKEEKTTVNGSSVSPRKLTVKLLSEKLTKPEARDIVALKVEVSGMKNNKPTRYVYHLRDYYDREHGITAMARTTAYPASITAQLILKDEVKEKGVVPPEKIGANSKLFQLFCEGLQKHGIKIQEEKITD
ncbi:MAG TPA: saccharopine dehydrogenase family protein [Candidatus Bathyarchaeia archaeon]|nr:saccharopine dehydrogenase family protein [Candidatus Bathyarchaeia archaeon]